jgi:hypothetical protein
MMLKGVVPLAETSEVLSEETIMGILEGWNQQTSISSVSGQDELSGTFNDEKDI